MLKLKTQTNNYNFHKKNVFLKKKKFYELNLFFKLIKLSKWSFNYYFNLPLNYQRTRSKKLNRKKIFYIKKLHKLIVRLFKFKKKKITTLRTQFEYINRFWYHYYNKEFFKIHNRYKRAVIMQKKKKIKPVNINLLKFKYVIRNFKTMNKKKQKFLKQFNLGFFFNIFE